MKRQGTERDDKWIEIRGSSVEKLGSNGSRPYAW